jgi:hypothetical protein
MTSETADPRPQNDQGSAPTHPQDTGTSMRREALLHNLRNRWVFPLYPVDDGICTCSDGAACHSPGLHALTPGGVTDATKDRAKVLEMWTQWPDARIGIPTGIGADFLVFNPDAIDGYEKYTPRFDALAAQQAAKWGSPADHGNALFRVENLSTWAREVDAAPDPGWIAEPVWPGDAYGVMAAESKAGKTWAQLDLAIAVATGTKWMNAFPTTQGTAVVFLGEGGERNTVRRLRAILKGHGLTEQDLGDHLHLCFRVPHLSDEEHIQEMGRVLADIGEVRLVILDPLYLAAGGANGSSLYDMAAPLEAAQHVTQQAGAALMVVHHFNQTGTGNTARRMSGAGPEEWGRVLATVSVVKSTVFDDGRTETAYLAWSFTGGEIVPITLTVKRTISVENRYDLTSPMTYEIEPTDTVVKLSGTVQAVLNVLTDHDGWLTTGEVHDQVSSSRDVVRRTVENALSSLHDDGHVERDGKKATGYSYRVPTPPATGGAQ